MLMTSLLKQGTLTDLTQIHQLQGAQLTHVHEQEVAAHRRAEDLEERRQDNERRSAQELLIDVTSHELRQPVSAILNCASLVRSNLALLRDELYHSITSETPFTPSIEVLNTIDEDLEALGGYFGALSSTI